MKDENSTHAYLVFYTFKLLMRLLASAGNQCGTSVFFPADAPARYHAWDEFFTFTCTCTYFFLRMRRLRTVNGIKWFIRTGGWWVRNVCC